MVYITGDCHGDWSRLSINKLPDHPVPETITHDDYVIVCGDFGLWHNSPHERWLLDELNNEPFTTLFVDGNHENFDRLYSDEFEVVDFHGGKAHKIRNNIYHLMRGYVFELCGKKFFTFGGASSHDIQDGILDRNDFKSDKEFKQKIFQCDIERRMFRVNHYSWWCQELPTQAEMDFGLKTLKEHNNKVDFIISHCCPQEVASIFSRGMYQPDCLTVYFNTVASTVDFSKWFFGHYHDNMQVFDKYIMLYNHIWRIV